MAEPVERVGERALAAAAQLVAELDQRPAVRACRLRPAALELEHRQVLDGLELVEAVAARAGERARLLEELRRLVEPVLVEAQHAERGRDRLVRDTFAPRERLRFHEHRVGVREIALEHREAARSLRDADDVLLVVAAARHALRLQDLLARAGEMPVHPAHVARHEIAAPRMRERPEIERLLGELRVLAGRGFPVRDRRRGVHDLAELERTRSAGLSSCSTHCRPRFASASASSFAKNRRHRRPADTIARAASAGSPLCAAWWARSAARSGSSTLSSSRSSATRRCIVRLRAGERPS